MQYHIKNTQYFPYNVQHHVDALLEKKRQDGLESEQYADTIREQIKDDSLLTYHDTMDENFCLIQDKIDLNCSLISQLETEVQKIKKTKHISAKAQDIYLVYERCKVLNEVSELLGKSNKKFTISQIDAVIKKM